MMKHRATHFRWRVTYTNGETFIYHTWGFKHFSESLSADYYNIEQLDNIETVETEFQVDGVWYTQRDYYQLIQED